ncbi:MAG: cyclase family protein [Chloroflexi bacterium]|jgi:arylformamidase|nr:cyclase family protein [Chloroflexota bacterium]
MLPIPKRIVDLSHTIIPGEEEYRLEIDTRPTSGWPQFARYQRPNDEWYIISEITLNTHVGTHIELPYHHVKDGHDAATYPLDNLAGEACVVDISDWGHNERIDLEGLKRKCAGLLQPGDIAYFYTGFDRYYRTEKQHNRPWFATECIHWLANDVRIKAMGVDTSGIEIRNPDGSPSIGQPNHEALLGKGIALVEYMANLGEFLNQRFYTYILPVKVRGAESFPVRVIGVQ